MHDRTPERLRSYNTHKIQRIQKKKSSTELNINNNNNNNKTEQKWHR